MNQTDDLDRRIGRWFDETAPTDAPPTLLDDTFARTSAMRQEVNRGWLAPFVRVASVAAVVIVAVAAGIGTANLLDGGPGIGTGPATASPTESPAASASLTAAPSDAPTMGAGDLLLRFEQACDVPPPVRMPTLTVLDDGRVLWQRSTDAGSEWVERRLSEDGLAAVRAAIAETGLLTTDGQYTAERRAGSPEPPGQGACVYIFVHRDGAIEATVSSLMWFGDEYEATYHEPDPERETLDAFAQRLREPEAWLTETDWVEPAARPYVAPTFLVVTREELGEHTDARDLATVAWPFGDPPGSYGEPAAGGAARCGVATREQVLALTDDPAAEVALTDGSVTWYVDFWPQMPDGAPGCEAAS